MSELFPLQGDRDEMEFWLGRKAAADPAFRQGLIEQTRATLEQLVGKPMPADIDVLVLEETPQELVLVKRVVGAVASGPAAEGDPVPFQFTRAFHHQLMREPELWAALQQDPRGVLAVRFGLELSLAVAVRLVEELPSQACMVLHYPPHYQHWAPSPELAAL